MDLGGFIISLEQKSILITGSTGFLAKIFLEKVLRVQPQVKKIFLLVRAEDNTSATQRFQKEVIGKEIFRVLREEHGNGFSSFISEKVAPVAGDISLENLGVKDSTLREEMWKEISFIVNVAGTTTFDERYDVALGINTFGARHICEFAKKCVKLEVLLHVSTAYVAREKEGLILEKPFLISETFNERVSLDIAVELKLAQERLKELHEKEATNEAITFSMKELGMQRARLFGWSNTYVFTKAMGEILFGQLRDDLTVVIVRPTIITSTYKDPFPGWMEGFRTIDTVVGSYGKGKLKHFLADPESVMDVIPGDMVVNAMIVAMAAHCRQPLEVIYHMGSSKQHPVNYSKLAKWAYQYFSKNPYRRQDGKLIRVHRPSLLPTLSTFYKFMNLRYKLPLQVLRMVNVLSIKSSKDLYRNLKKKYNLMMRFVKLYEPFIFFKGIFDDSNMERLRESMKDGDGDTEMFRFDPKRIDWEDYFVNVHIPGFTKYVLK